MRERGGQCELTVFSPFCRWVVFCLRGGFFLRGFAEHVSLPLICVADAAILLFMEQCLFFPHGHLQGDTKQ